jgi:PII-like signaling protein
MQTKIKTHKLGKLRIYIATDEKIKSASLLQKLFPRNKYRQLIIEAKKDGIMNASVFNTHFGYSNNGRIQQISAETGNAGLTICIELIDDREKLETFFSKHKDMLKGKVVVYKEVEFWDID